MKLTVEAKLQQLETILQSRTLQGDAVKNCQRSLRIETMITGERGVNTTDSLGINQASLALQ